MNDQVVVKAGSHEAACQALRNARNTMNGYKEDMVGKLEQYTASWEGEAKEAYRAVLREWNQSMEEMDRIVNGIDTALANIGGAYGATERGNVQIFS